MTTEDIAQIAEDFRLYCLSHWSDLYLLHADGFNAPSASDLTGKAWYESRNIERTALQEEHVAAFLRAYFGPISPIGTRGNSPEIVVIEISEDAQSRSMGPVSAIFLGRSRRAYIAKH